MAIAQSTLPTDNKSQKRRRRETTPNPHLDFAAVRRSAKKLLSQNLLPYQHRLNSKLLSQLFIAFQDWLAEFELEIVSQLEHCLLYTSPSPRDQRGSRMPSSA